MKEYRILKYNLETLEKIDIETADTREMKDITFVLSIKLEKESLLVKVQFEDSKISVYLENGTLAVSGTSINALSSTDILKNTAKNEEKIIIICKEYALLSYVIYQKIIENNKKKIVKSGEITKVKIPKYGLEYKEYEYSPDDAHVLYKTEKGYHVMNIEYTKRTMYSLPSDLYFFINGEINCYTSKNTEIMTDMELSNILSSLPLKLGDCYNNTRLILNALKKCGYTEKHKVERKFGWIISIEPILHAWIVIDEKFLIDPNDNYACMQVRDNLEALKKGQAQQNTGIEVKREKIVSDYKECIKKPYFQRGNYGKAKPWNVYLGVTANHDEEQEFINNLFDRFPNHPALEGIDKETGNNKLHDMARNIGL